LPLVYIPPIFGGAWEGVKRAASPIYIRLSAF